MCTKYEQTSQPARRRLAPRRRRNGYRSLWMSSRSHRELNTPLPRVPSLTLPVELITRIADFVFDIKPPVDDLAFINSTKPNWSDVVGFMSASFDFHRIGFLRWIAVLNIKDTEDWDVAKGHSHWVREIRCSDGVFGTPQHNRVLSCFVRLYAISIDAHGDVSRGSRGQFAYRDIFRALPPSLRRLEITRAHGPDVRVIATVKKYCPSLEELRLGRCTMFNSSPACEFWESFPFDHDSYMSDQDSDAYAVSLSKELLPLKNLRSLRLGLYLIPSTTVIAHRIYHRQNLPTPSVIDWQQPIPLALFAQLGYRRSPAELLLSLLQEQDPESEFGPNIVCTTCAGAVDEVNKRAEGSANAILKKLIPSLETVQWMRWLSAGHLGLSTYHL